jgi:hypothetical protein
MRATYPPPLQLINGSAAVDLTSHLFSKLYFL